MLESDAQRQVAETGDPRLAGGWPGRAPVLASCSSLFAQGLCSPVATPAVACPRRRCLRCATALAFAEAAAGRLVDSRHASLRPDLPSALAVQSFDGWRDDAAITAVLRDAGASGVRVDSSRCGACLPDAARCDPERGIAGTAAPSILLL